MMTKYSERIDLIFDLILEIIIDFYCGFYSLRIFIKVNIYTVNSEFKPLLFHFLIEFKVKEEIVPLYCTIHRWFTLYIIVSRNSGVSKVR